MRKITQFIMTAGMVLSLCSCGGNSSGPEVSDAADQSAAGQKSDDSSGPAVDKTEVQPGHNLRFLCSSDSEGCYTENGYYYLTWDTEKLSDGSYGSHLMYMDFATLQEVYLCSNAGCSHNTSDCQSVFLYDDFPSATTLLFTYGDSLYILSKASDNDGAVYSDMAYEIGADEGGQDMFRLGVSDEAPTVLYRANLDGTDREKVYTFDSSVIVEDFVIGDENGIYVVTKKLSTDKDGSNIYVTSAERRLVNVDWEFKSERQVCSLDFGDNISWRVAGCYGKNLVLEGMDYGREVTRDELYDDNAWRNVYLNSEEVFATLDIENGKMTEKYRLNNRGSDTNVSSEIVDGGKLYVSNAEDGTVKCLDLDSGEERTLCTLEDNSFYLCGIVGDKLRCQDEEWGPDFYYVDVNTGEVSHSGLVNKSLGWSLEFRAVLDTDVLVIYDYEATPSPFGDGAYEITRYQFGLIAQSDLFAGNDNYRTIQMVGSGR